MAALSSEDENSFFRPVNDTAGQEKERNSPRVSAKHGEQELDRAGGNHVDGAGQGTLTSVSICEPRGASWCYFAAVPHAHLCPKPSSGLRARFIYEELSHPARDYNHEAYLGVCRVADLPQIENLNYRTGWNRCSDGELAHDGQKDRTVQLPRFTSGDKIDFHLYFPNTEGGGGFYSVTREAEEPVEREVPSDVLPLFRVKGTSLTCIDFSLDVTMTKSARFKR
jgi:hypothetical protein